MSTTTSNISSATPRVAFDQTWIEGLASFLEKLDVTIGFGRARNAFQILELARTLGQKLLTSRRLTGAGKSLNRDYDKQRTQDASTAV